MLNQNHSPWPPNSQSKNPKFKNSNPNYYNNTHPNDPLGVTDIYQRRNSRHFHRRKSSGRRFAPYAPRNTTSFLIRAKKSGGIALPASPCPVTPAVLPTPEFSPAREVVVETAKEEWGVNVYGTMSGLIRVRELGGNCEVERRLDHDFEESMMSLKERLFSMETDLEDMRRRVLVLEMRGRLERGNVDEFGSDNEAACYVFSGRSRGGGACHHKHSC